MSRELPPVDPWLTNAPDPDEDVDRCDHGVPFAEECEDCDLDYDDDLEDEDDEPDPDEMIDAEIDRQIERDRELW